MELIDTRIYDDFFLLSKIFNTVKLNTKEKESLYKHFEKSKHGRWIDEGYYADHRSERAYGCSECGWHMLSYPNELFRYCPYCGAKMDEVKE